MERRTRDRIRVCQKVEDEEKSQGGVMKKRGGIRKEQKIKGALRGN